MNAEQIMKNICGYGLYPHRRQPEELRTAQYLQDKIAGQLKAEIVPFDADVQNTGGGFAGGWAWK